MGFTVFFSNSVRILSPSPYPYISPFWNFCQQYTGNCRMGGGMWQDDLRVSACKTVLTWATERVNWGAVNQQRW